MNIVEWVIGVTAVISWAWLLRELARPVGFLDADLRKPRCECRAGMRCAWCLGAVLPRDKEAV